MQIDIDGVLRNVRRTIEIQSEQKLLDYVSAYYIAPHILECTVCTNTMYCDIILPLVERVQRLQEALNDD